MDWTDRLANKLGELFRKRTEEKTAPAPSAQKQGPVLYYTETFIDHFTNPRNVGEMNQAEADGYALIGDPTCGDQMKLWIKVSTSLPCQHQKSVCRNKDSFHFGYD